MREADAAASKPKPQPVRLQLSRRKGFDLARLSWQTNGLEAVIVARPTKWGNPFIVGEFGPAKDCVLHYRCVLAGGITASDDALWQAQQRLYKHAKANLQLLRGRNLACWCRRGQPCHADALLELANSPDKDVT